METKREAPSPLELQILSLLWRRGLSTVRQVLESMPDGKLRVYTSILPAMQGMEKRGMLAHDVEKNAYVHRPIVTKKHVLGPWLRSLVRELFGGSPVDAARALLQYTRVSGKELARIKKLVAEEGGGGRRK